MGFLFCSICNEPFDDGDLIYVEQGNKELHVCPDCYEEYIFNEDDYVGGNNG